MSEPFTDEMLSYKRKWAESILSQPLPSAKDPIYESMAHLKNEAESTLSFLATIDERDKRIEELENKAKVYVQNGAYITAWNDGCRVMSAKNITLQTCLERMEGALKKISSWDCCCADYDGKCGVCVARQALTPDTSEGEKK